jgi:hypothetical protein
MMIAASLTENEGRALGSAVEQLRRTLAEASQRDWKIECDFSGAATRPEICIISLLPEAERPDAIDGVRQRLRERVSDTVAAGASVFLCTIFRACENDASKLERIRRLNLLAPDLSHDLDVGVIDFDRMLGDIGSQTLETDYRLDGAGAREVAAYTIVTALLRGGLDEHVPGDVLERARSIYDRAGRASAGSQ